MFALFDALISLPHGYGRRYLKVFHSSFVVMSIPLCVVGSVRNSHLDKLARHLRTHTTCCLEDRRSHVSDISRKRSGPLPGCANLDHLCSRSRNIRSRTPRRAKQTREAKCTRRCSARLGPFGATTEQEIAGTVPSRSVLQTGMLGMRTRLLG